MLLLRGLLERLRRRIIGERLRGDRDRLRGGVRERERLRDRLRIGDLSFALPFFALSSDEFLSSSAYRTSEIFVKQLNRLMDGFLI